MNRVMPKGCEYPVRLGDGVAAPGEDCDGVVVTVDDETGGVTKVTVLWQSGLVMTDSAADVVPLAGARAGSAGAAMLALRCIAALTERLHEGNAAVVREEMVREEMMRGVKL